MTVIRAQFGDRACVAARDQLPVAEPLHQASSASPDTSAQVLITEQQVMLGSAIAISAPLPSRHDNPFLAVIRGLHRVITWEPDGSPHDRNLKHARRTSEWYSEALMPPA
jgi:hypothetical protein